jgi:hypothetical protein
MSTRHRLELTGFAVVRHTCLALLTCLTLLPADNPKVFTRCGHHFHMPCIYEWLERKDTCPMCESKMVFEGEDEE